MLAIPTATRMSMPSRCGWRPYPSPVSGRQCVAGPARQTAGDWARASGSAPGSVAIPAIPTLVSGLPFLRGAVSSMTKGGGVTIDTLVSCQCGKSGFARECDWLTVIWLLNFGEYLQALTLRRTRRTIRALLGMAIMRSGW